MRRKLLVVVIGGVLLGAAFLLYPWTQQSGEPTATPTQGPTNTTPITENKDTTPSPVTELQQAANAGNENAGTAASSTGVKKKTSSSGNTNSSTPPNNNGIGGSGGGGPVPPGYLSLKIMGTSTSGLEFAGMFQANSAPTYTYFKNKGFNVIRLPFDWNELQPDLFGAFDNSAKTQIDQNIAWAKANNLAIVLDAHNYGRRYINREGGFSDDFGTSSSQHTFIVPWGDQNQANATFTFRDFGRGRAGALNNPVAPADSYKVTLDARINSTNGDSWNEFQIDPYYVNDNNRYSFRMIPQSGTWQLRKVIAGTSTIIASGSKTWTAGQYYHIDIDVNQATAGKINVAVDGTPLFTANTVNSDPALTRGYVSVFPNGVNATIKAFTLNVDGDTTSGGPALRRVTDAGLPITAWDDFWTKLSQAYKTEDTIFAYDHNEPHDMPIPTVPTNYSAAVAAANSVPTATATVIAQHMTDAIRATGDTKFIVVDMDHWANTHYFQTQYGINPTPWVIDTLSPQKIVYSGHYYFDSDHSGTNYGSSTPQSAAAVSAEVTPFFQWCNDKLVACYMGEFGVPNTSQWQPIMTDFLGMMKQHNIWWAQWAGGDLYSASTTLQPTSSYTVDRLQMTTISDFLSH
jgi:hypothetical protein